MRNLIALAILAAVLGGIIEAAPISTPWIYAASSAKNLAAHIKSPSVGTVTAAPQTGAGSTATCTLAHASDVAGTATITLGGTGIAAGAQCVITFVKAYAVAPICVLTDTSNVGETDGVKAYATSGTANATINFTAAGTTAHVYAYNFLCIETQ